MASIQERTNQNGTTSYKVTIRLKGHRSETGTFKRKTDAKRWAQQTKRPLGKDDISKPERQKKTVEDLIDENFLFSVYLLDSWAIFHIIENVFCCIRVFLTS